MENNKLEKVAMGLGLGQIFIGSSSKYINNNNQILEVPIEGLCNVSLKLGDNLKKEIVISMKNFLKQSIGLTNSIIIECDFERVPIIQDGYYRLEIMFTYPVPTDHMTIILPKVKVKSIHKDTNTISFKSTIVDNGAWKKGKFGVINNLIT